MRDPYKSPQPSEKAAALRLLAELNRTSCVDWHLAEDPWEEEIYLIPRFLLTGGEKKMWAITTDLNAQDEVRFLTARIKAEDATTSSEIRALFINKWGSPSRAPEAAHELCAWILATAAAEDPVGYLLAVVREK